MYGKKSSPIIFQAPPFLLDWSLARSLTVCVCVLEWKWQCMRICLCTLYGLMIASIRRHFPTTKIPFHFVRYGCVRDSQKPCSLCYGRLFPLVCMCMCLCIWMYVFAHAFFILACCDGCIIRRTWSFGLPGLYQPRNWTDWANLWVACFLPDKIYTQTSLSLKIFHLNAIFLACFFW